MRNFRIFLASVILIASLLWLALGTGLAPYAGFAGRMQIVPSAIHTCLGTTIVWIIATLLFGRIYCAAVCPVGSLQDVAIWLRRKSSRRKAFRFKEGHTARYVILIAYLASLAFGAIAVGFVIEPWNLMRNTLSAVNPADTAATWGSIGVSTAIGAMSGIVSLSAIMIWAWISGRAFCSEVCPIGTMLGCVHTQTLMHIAIDSDRCVSCMKCEDICRSRCIKVETRHVDNSRCVLCFDCTAVCPNDAIRYQINRDRHRQTPILTPSQS